MLGNALNNGYLSGGFNIGQYRAYYDSFRISKIARYTSHFMTPTAKFASDGNTVFLLNFPTDAPTGTIEGLVNNRTKAFIPVATSNGATQVNPGYIGNLQLSDNGIWANWMTDSIIENISVSNAGRTCINLANNDYQDVVYNAWCPIVPTPETNVGFLFGNQSNNNIYDHLHCDGQYTCIGQYGGSGHYILPDYTGRGYAIYPFYFIQAQAILDSPVTDIEDTEANQLAAVLSKDAYAPIIINGGQLYSGASGSAYLAINGGAPVIDTGTQFQGGSPAEILNVVSNPRSPVIVNSAVLPSKVPLTNEGKSWWMHATIAGLDLGVKFADLPTPGTTTNGQKRYCVDRDPAVNPPTTCTSAGTKTGRGLMDSIARGSVFHKEDMLTKTESYCQTRI